MLKAIRPRDVAQRRKRFFINHHYGGPCKDIWGRQSWADTALLVAHSLASVSVWLQPNFKYQIVYFQVYGRLAEENITYQRIQKIAWRMFFT